MADRINLNRLKNINFAPNKNVAKTTAAVTLLLSTVACSNGNGGDIGYCFLAPAIMFVGLLAIIYASVGGGGGGGGSSGPSNPSGY